MPGQRLAVVVGAASDLGHAVARRLAADGFEVLSADRAEWAGGAGIDESPKVSADPHTADGARAVADWCRVEGRMVDALFHAGVAMDYWDGGWGEPENWLEVLSANVCSPMLYIRELAGRMRTPGGAIILLGSVDGLLGNPRLPLYSAAKGALVPLVHTLAHRLGAQGVRVNLVATAAIYQVSSFELQPSRRPTSLEGLVAHTPLGRVAEPEDVAGVVSFLAGPDSGYVSGAVIPVDGGRTGITPGTG